MMETKPAVKELFALLLVCAVFESAAVLSRVPLPRPPVYYNDSVSLCHRRCQLLRYTDLKAKYPGTFYTKEEFAEAYQLPEKGTRRPECSMPALPALFGGKVSAPICSPCKFGQHDGDQCCGTCRYFEQAPEFIDGYSCWVLKLPGNDQYQYITKGVCSSNAGTCRGQCKEEKSFHKLLVWCYWLGFQFKYMEHSEYCSCKG